MKRKGSVLNRGADRSEQKCDDCFVTASVKNQASMAARSMNDFTYCKPSKLVNSLLRLL